jgi:putative salt-induced outer membrane protein
VQFGLVATSGNTETQTANFGFKVENDGERWRHRLRGQALKATDHGETTAERYLLDANSRYKLNERSFLFGNVRYNRDLFSGYVFQVSETGGYGHRWMPTSKLDLEAQGGGGVRQSQEQGGDYRTEGIVRGAVLLRWAFSAQAELQQDITVESSSFNTVTESVTSLKSTIVGNLAMKFSIDVTHNSTVPAGTKKTDTFTSVNLVYNF